MVVKAASAVPLWVVDALDVLDELAEGSAPLARLTIAPPQQMSLDPSPLLAGVAEVDITPPPGMPKAGYSANANDGSGFRTRLRARIFHLRSGTASIAIVACDLLGGSSIVRDLILRRIVADTDIQQGGLFLGATHTHAGPGQFLGSAFYNRFASNRVGFDPRWTRFLVEQIADGIVAAVESREPALVATGSTDVWGLTRNRSLEPHTKNSSVNDKRLTPERKYASVNPTLHMVRVDAAQSRTPLGALSVFSVHGTGISMTSKEYNADLWAYLNDEVARRVEHASGERIVAGAIEGTHADVAPALRPGRPPYAEAERVGRGIGEHAAALWASLESRLTGELELASAWRSLALDSGADSIDGIRIAAPAVGAALVAGANENETPIVRHLPPFRAGTPNRWRRRGGQGTKWVLGSRLQPLVLPKREFPRVLPLQLLRIGQLHLLGTPFEITVETGRRVAAAAREALGPTATVAVSSVANEYCGYCATAEEYELQHYEGGHTLHGPRSQEWLAAQSRQLAADLEARGSFCDSVERTYSLPIKRYLASTRRASSGRRVTDPPWFDDPDAAHNECWALDWLGPGPNTLTWHAPIAGVEVLDGATWTTLHTRGAPVDDRGTSMSVEYVGPEGRTGDHRFRTRWFEPQLDGTKRYRFVLFANNGQPRTVSAVLGDRS